MPGMRRPVRRMRMGRGAIHLPRSLRLRLPLPLHRRRTAVKAALPLRHLTANDRPGPAARVVRVRIGRAGPAEALLRWRMGQTLRPRPDAVGMARVAVDHLTGRRALHLHLHLHRDLARARNRARRRAVDLPRLWRGRRAEYLAGLNTARWGATRIPTCSGWQTEDFSRTRAAVREFLL